MKIDKAKDICVQRLTFHLIKMNEAWQVFYFIKHWQTRDKGRYKNVHEDLTRHGKVKFSGHDFFDL